VPAFAKINLGLEVLGQRTDGYHELRTLFQTIDLHDDIRLTPRPRAVSLECDDPRLPVDERNLALRAALALKRFCRTSRGAHIAIRKRIPIAAGLAGGSSDAAAVLRGLDGLWGLGLGPAGLLPLARRLGADVPYFLFGGTALGIGRGDEIYPLAIQLRAHVVVIDMGCALSTPAVFARLPHCLTPRENSNNIFRFISGYGENGGAALSVLSNDLESAALEEAPDLEPQIRRVRSVLSGAGAQLAALSGSGAAFFGVFDGARTARAATKQLEASGSRVLSSRTLSANRYRTLWNRALASQLGTESSIGSSR
jgi:4-diphosphocytidyl-2-C-methyl-D-erythritol kinase